MCFRRASAYPHQNDKLAENDVTNLGSERDGFEDTKTHSQTRRSRVCFQYTIIRGLSSQALSICRRMWAHPCSAHEKVEGRYCTPRPLCTECADRGEFACD